MIKAFRMMAPFIKKYRWKYIIGALFLIIVDGLSLLVPQVIRQFTDWVQFSTRKNSSVCGLDDPFRGTHLRRTFLMENASIWNKPRLGI